MHTMISSRIGDWIGSTTDTEILPLSLVDFFHVTADVVN